MRTKIAKAVLYIGSLMGSFALLENEIVNGLTLLCVLANVAVTYWIVATRKEEQL